MTMLLYTTRIGYLVVDGERALLLCRLSQRLIPCTAKDGREMLEITEKSPAEAVFGVLGRLALDGQHCAFVIAAASPVATLTRRDHTDCPVMRVDRVRAFPLATESSPPGSRSSRISAAAVAASKLRMGQKAIMKFVSDKIGNANSMLEELLRLFNDVPDFYYCIQRDITHSTQRHFSSRSETDDRFFWNRHMLDDLFEGDIHQEMAKDWRLPIMQGFACSYELSIMDDLPISGESNGTTAEESKSTPSPTLRVTLISRRDVRRAGARYLRRGIDEEANVANFVETELLLNICDHHLSFVQVRGSVPLFWSQHGFRYRPALSIERAVDESLPYFRKHMQGLIEDYGRPVIAVSLVDQAGRELRLATSYVEHALKADLPELHLYSFDFHRHCKGLKFDKVHELVGSLDELLSGVGFCWVDRTGELVRRQVGVVRTNCVDCLDRTNVVQGAISQSVCMGQAMRLGLFGPLAEPPEPLVSALQTMWADNGDAISRQYSGTAALKGDITRCGERKLSGIVKDGMSSATRYYLCHVRDSTRQRAINVLLNQPDLPQEALQIAASGAEAGEDDEEENESIGRLVSETSHFLLPESEALVGGWALVDFANSGDQVDTVMLLTRSHIYIAIYDDDSEKLLDVHIVPLEQFDSLEIGRPSPRGRALLRISTHQGAWCCRAANVRLFNSVVIGLKSDEEADEYIESITEQIRVTIETATGIVLPILRPPRLVLPSRTGSANASRLLNTLSAVLRPRRQATRAPSPFTPAITSTEQPSTEEEHGDNDGGDTAGGGLAPPASAMRMSVSDGGLSERLARGFRGLRGGGAGVGQQSSAGRSHPSYNMDPFAKYKEQASNSNNDRLVFL